MPALSKFLPRRRFFRSGLAAAAALLTGSSLFRTAANAGEGAPGASPVKTVMFFGDSLTAGYGLEDPATESYPGRIAEKMKTAAPDWKVVNAGLSGETTSGGLRRIDWVLRQPVGIFVLALGGNDGLRGIGAPVTKSNLEAIIKKVRTRYPQAVVVLAGMKMPVSMGAYAAEFEAVFASVAAADKTVVPLPFLLEGVGGLPRYNQPDAIHPNAEGAKLIADHVWKTLEPLLGKSGS